MKRVFGEKIKVEEWKRLMKEENKGVKIEEIKGN